MEIERKFLIDWKEIDALGLPLVKQAQSWQGYLSAATPVVRIRKRDRGLGDVYKRQTISCASKARESWHGRKSKRS